MEMARRRSACRGESLELSDAFVRRESSDEDERAAAAMSTTKAPSLDSAWPVMVRTSSALSFPVPVRYPVVPPADVAAVGEVLPILVYAVTLERFYASIKRAVPA